MFYNEDTGEVLFTKEQLINCLSKGERISIRTMDTWDDVMGNERVLFSDDFGDLFDDKDIAGMLVDIGLKVTVYDIG